jgi:hypothetical protein
MNLRLPGPTADENRSCAFRVTPSRQPYGHSKWGGRRQKATDEAADSVPLQFTNVTRLGRGKI